MANKPRGDAVLVIDKKPRILRLTLGAIAEIEDELDIGLAQLGEIMQQGRMKPVSVVLYWMFRAGGWDDITRDDLLTMDISMDELMPQFSTALSAFTGSDGDADSEEK